MTLEKKLSDLNPIELENKLNEILKEGKTKKEFVPQLIKLLQKRENYADLQTNIELALYHLDTDSIHSVTEFFNDESTYVRQTLCHALGQMYEKYNGDDLPYEILTLIFLSECMEDENRFVRTAAIRSLGKMKRIMEKSPFIEVRKYLKGYFEKIRKDKKVNSSVRDNASYTLIRWGFLKPEKWVKEEY